ncbi:MAG TPA: sulfatase [Rubrobacteraceae bacterium]|nr:sulfatase [Rubrobacteraceae bacterium]
MNVILIVLDSLRKDHIGAYGSDRVKTPTLDALSKESLRFTQAYPESVPTIPARRAIHTGIRTWPFRNWVPQKGETFFPAGWQRIPEDQTTLSEILLPQGYNTALITDTQHEFKASMNFQRGFDIFDFIRGQERDHYHSVLRVSDDMVDRNTVSGNTSGMRGKVRQYLANTMNRKTEEDWFAPRVFLRAGEYLEVAREGQPFFLLVDSFDPHEPWDPPEKYVKLYSDDYDGPDPIVPNYSDAGWITDRELERMKALYSGEITMVDHWLGNFLNKVSDLGLLDNTLILVLSDHGVALGEHNDTGKPDWALYPELTDIPFFIRHPEGKGAGETSDYYASIHDVAPTVLGATSIEQKDPMDGEDLSVILDGKDPAPRSHFTLGYNDYVRSHDDRYVMISRNDGAEAKLFDIQSDPDMKQDIAGDNRDIVQRMFNDYALRDAGGSIPRY